jgi:hypothetical protein
MLSQSISRWNISTCARQALPIWTIHTREERNLLSNCFPRRVLFYRDTKEWRVTRCRLTKRTVAQPLAVNKHASFKKRLTPVTQFYLKGNTSQSVSRFVNQSVALLSICNSVTLFLGQCVWQLINHTIITLQMKSSLLVSQFVSHWDSLFLSKSIN